MNKAQHIIIALLTASVLVVTLILALSIDGPTITPVDLRKPTTEDDLTCSWIPSPDTTSQNITWMNGSQTHSHQTISGSATSSILLAFTARKGELWTCNVTSTNNTHTTWSSASVSIKNALPTPPNATDHTFYENIPISIQLSSTDPDGDQLTYYKLGTNPAYCDVHATTGQVNCTPDQEHVGIVDVTFFVSDGGAYFAQTNVTYTVIEVNDPPQFTPPLTNQNATEGVLFNYTLNVTDEEDHLPINFSIESNLSSIVIHQTADNQAYITFDRPSNAPLYSERGTWYVTVNITDAGPTDNTIYDDPTTIQTFYLTVLTLNQRPNITTNLSTIQGMQGEQLTVIIEGFDPDEDDTLEFAITSNCSIPNPWSIVTTNNSHNATGLIDVLLTNDHVACRNVNITLSDGEYTAWAWAELNLTNINDPPTIHEMSMYPANTHQNISNITGVKGRELDYTINATDPDQLTYQGDTLTYEAYTSLFTIHNETGRITFLPGDEHVGTHEITINVTDSGLGGPRLSDTRTLTLHIINNTAPILDPIGVIDCVQDTPCVYEVTAVDPDVGEVLTFTHNSTLFNFTTISNLSVLIDFTPSNDDVGREWVLITVRDNFGFTDSELVLINITNVNDPPYFEDIVSFGTVVQDVTSTTRINVTDDDVRVSILKNFDPPLDYLTYNYSFINTTGNLDQNFSISEEGLDYFVVSFTPTIDHLGEHTVNLSVTDSFGEMYWQNITFEVLAKTEDPTIISIRPHNNNSETSTSFGNANLFPLNTTAVTFLENTTVRFDALAINDSSIPDNSLTYRYYLNDELVKTQTQSTPGLNSHYNHYFGFFDEGEHTMRLVVSDTRYSSAQWTWELEIIDVNRPPVLVNNLPNVTANTTISIYDYFSYRGGYQRFYDPDDDVNEDGLRGEIFGESTSLTYSLSPGSVCTQAMITYSGDDLSLTPLQVGTCIVNFRATDPEGLFVDSNPVWITITDVIFDEQEVQSASGGQSLTRPQIVPIPFDDPVNVPVSFKLLHPENAQTLITHIEIPVALINTWNETLRGIHLNTSTTADQEEGTNQLSLSTYYVEQLGVGENTTVYLSINNYRIEDPFSITVNATVERPVFSDIAVILINALEKTDFGENTILKITFARDLLNENPECHELNDLLDAAERSRIRGEYQDMFRLIDSAMEGCKYLINTQKAVEPEQPKAFYTFTSYVSRNVPASIILGVIITVMVGFGISMIVTARKHADDI